jgi:hypothetical protein
MVTSYRRFSPCFRSKEVVSLYDEVLQVWFQQHNSDPLQLLENLEAENNEKVAELALKRIFATQTMDLNRFKYEEIDFKFALFWRVYCEWVKETKVHFHFISLFSKQHFRLNFILQVKLKSSQKFLFSFSALARCGGYFRAHSSRDQQILFVTQTLRTQ